MCSVKSVVSCQSVDNAGVSPLHTGSTPLHHTLASYRPADEWKLYLYLLTYWLAYLRALLAACERVSVSVSRVISFFVLVTPYRSC